KGLHYLETITASTRQMGALIDNLLHFSRTGRVELQKKNVDMNQLLQEVSATFQMDSLNGSNVVLGRNIEWVISALPSVRGDYALLRQVWHNLLANAIKYTQTREHARIEVSAHHENGKIIFVVADNGVGFDMQYTDKLFGIFQRLHSSEEFEGTGIGLAIVKKIIDRHGGQVWASAEVDVGAKFYFSLPN
ncbi:MAG: GHKL domain-containing protein, partial [Oligoflexia bacterium]|nr:GHKL domain-containing protein [Oligoflexia bacterium]